VTILASYANKDILLLCYTKFMQARITDLRYDYLGFELELIEKLSPNLGKDNTQKLVDAVNDIVRSKINNDAIHKISTNILNPIILDKSAWQIYNTSEMELEYPSEMKCYLDIISKYYQDIYSNKYIINWQPTMGMACFEASLGSKSVNIICNILQAIGLLYLNDHPDTTIQQFSVDTLINLKLARKIFESLFEANLVVIRDNDQGIYTVNLVNYTGNTDLDIRPIFVEVFVEERES
ncbi:MAG: cullin, partial [Nitrososphaerota archaeon]